MDEYPGTTPMLETTSFRSCAGIVWWIACSTRPMSWLVTSTRVPDGALRLITNCRASVRGKNASPSTGHRRKPANETATMPIATARGRSSARRTLASYWPLS